MGKSSPKAPDPVATASAQAAANRNTAITQQQLNMVDQYNPWGSVTYDQTGTSFTPGEGIGTGRYLYNPTTGEYRPYSGGGARQVVGAASAGLGGFGGLGGRGAGFGGNAMIPSIPGGGESTVPTNATSGIPDGWQVVSGNLTPKYSQTTTLSPEQQAIFDQTQVAEGNLAGLASEQSAKLRSLLGTNFEFNNDDASNWAYDLASQRILPQQAQQAEALRTRLKNQGIQEGSAAWNAEFGRLTNSNTDQLNQLALTGRQQAFSEQMAQRNQPINEITALLSGSQVSNPATMSGASPQAQVGGVDYSGLVQQNYNNQLQAHNAKMGGIGGLFGSVMGAAGQAGGFGSLLALSDRRLKQNIRRIGSTGEGVPLYLYNYIGSDVPQIGVMAQEMRLINPDAVAELPSGYLAVDYAEVK